MLLFLTGLLLGLLGLAIGFCLTLLVTGDKKQALVGAGIAGLVGLVVLPLLIQYGAGLYTDYLLYDSMKLADIFLRRLGIWWKLFGAGFAISLVFLGGNVFAAASIVPERVNWIFRLLILGLVLAIAVSFGLFAAGTWDEILLWQKQVPFGKTDPLFGRDIGWYVFSYPFYSRIIQWGFALVGLGAIAVGVVYFAQAMRYYEAGGQAPSEIAERERAILRIAIRHLGILAAIFALLLAGYWVLRRAALPIDAFSGSGYAGAKIEGAGWVDHHFVSGALSVLPWFSVAIALACLFAAFKQEWKILAASVGITLTYSLLILPIAPGIVWSLKVRPAELAKETPYIRWSNEASLEAYDLGTDNLVVIKDFPAKGLTAEAVKEAPEEIFENLRLLDPFEVALRNFDQDEEQRSYYDFLDPDVVLYRYPDGRPVQVMLSARELPVEQIPTRTWVNEHLVFTHGRGITMAQVNDFDSEGNMSYLVRGVPGKGPFVPQEEAIYYGEACEEWIATGTTEKEVGPPTPGGAGWEEVEYQGEGGVSLGSGWRRLAFALRFDDLTLLLSSRLRPESRIHFRRNIQERISHIVPFLWLDDDPYVISEKYLHWMWDGATWARHYPYADSQKVGENTFRYVRPSVKITMDSYNGIPDFYVIDKEDPVLQTWMGIFPSLFKDLSEMPDELKAHIRYPEQVFILQAKILRRHHMTDPVALYNEEDLWEIAKEQSEGRIQETAPRYVLTVLPGEEELEYILDWSYTRIDKQNGIAFLAARSRPDRYGEIVLYAYPIGRMIMGPAQMEKLIDQDPELGPKLTLISQQGKEVIRGNLIALPLKESMIYVKPLYVRATTDGGGEGLPQLRFVVVGSVEREIAFGRSLDEALGAFVREEVEIIERPGEGRPEVTGCAKLWRRLKKAVEERNTAEAARLSVEILVTCH